MEKEMTYREWFEKNLPEDVAKKAIANTRSQIIDDGKGVCIGFLTSAFSWRKTPEGFHFWNKWYKKTKHL